MHIEACELTTQNLAKIKNMNHKSFLKLTMLVLALLPATVLADGDSGSRGAVYTMDNSTSGNHVLAFQRAADGSLTSAGAFPTGGSGTGSGLGNQGALVLGQGERWLFACNAASSLSDLESDRSGGILLSVSRARAK